MANLRAAETLAARVLERWCLVGDEPMNGEEWDGICALAGVDPVKFSALVAGLIARTTPEERQARARQLARERSQDNAQTMVTKRSNNGD